MSEQEQIAGVDPTVGTCNLTDEERAFIVNVLSNVTFQGDIPTLTATISQALQIIRKLS